MMFCQQKSADCKRSRGLRWRELGAVVMVENWDATYDSGERLQEHECKTDSHAVTGASLEQLHELLLLCHLES